MAGAGEQVGFEQLHRDVAAKAEVAGEPDHGHAAHAQQPVELVGVRERRKETPQIVAHGATSQVIGGSLSLERGPVSRKPAGHQNLGLSEEIFTLISRAPGKSGDSD